MDFKIKVKNFGSVLDGNFELKDLTIFIGDNDSGKSFIAKLIYIVIKYFQSSGHETFNELYSDIPLYDKLYNLLNPIQNNNFKKKQSVKLNHEIEIDKKTLSILEKSLEESFIHRIKKSLKIYFSNNLSNLININKDMAEINFETEFCNIDIKIYKNNEINLKFNYKNISKKHILNFKFNFINNLFNDSFTSDYKIEKNKNIIFDVEVINSNIDDFSFFFELIDAFHYQISHLIFHPKSNLSIDYFPANKSAVISNYNTKFRGKVTDISSYIFSDDFFKDESLYEDNYILNDFIDTFQRFSKKMINQSFASSKSYEYLKSIVNGEIFFDENKSLKYKLLKDKNKLNIEIENLSSKITELIPLLLYLEKTDFNRFNKMLIIEEPEAHLNPKMQRVLARLLVMIMSEGVKLIVTTHSDYILNELDILLKLNHIKERDGQKYIKFIENDRDYLDLMALDKNKLAVYRFIKEGFSTKIENIKITKNRVVEKEFSETSENLYLENSKVIEILKNL